MGLLTLYPEENLKEHTVEAGIAILPLTNNKNINNTSRQTKVSKAIASLE